MSNKPKIDRSMLYLAQDLGRAMANLDHAFWEIYGVSGRSDSVIAAALLQAGRDIKRHCDSLSYALGREAENADKSEQDSKE